jgi:iron complex transport system substrate-binding protein
LKKAVTSLFVAVILIAWCGLGWAMHTRQDSAAAPMGQPQRIVSLTPDVTEILFALGLGDKVVGVSTFCDYPPEAAAKSKVGTYWEPDMEAIVSRRPDLIAGERSSKSDVLQRLDRMGYRTASIKMDTIADMSYAIDTLAHLTGQLSQRVALDKEFAVRLAAVSDAVTERPKPRVLWVIQAEPLRVAGRNTFVNEIIELAGGRNAIGPTTMAYPPLGIEQVLGAQVDVIIQPAMIGAIPLEEQQAMANEYWRKWHTIPAVQSGAIYVVPPDTVSRLGPRLPLGVEMVARLLHPGCFAGDNEGNGK